VGYVIRISFHLTIYLFDLTTPAVGHPSLKEGGELGSGGVLSEIKLKTGHGVVLYVLKCFAVACMRYYSTVWPVRYRTGGCGFGVWQKYYLMSTAAWFTGLCGSNLLCRDMPTKT